MKSLEDAVLYIKLCSTWTIPEIIEGMEMAVCEIYGIRKEKLDTLLSEIKL